MVTKRGISANAGGRSIFAVAVVLLLLALSSAAAAAAADLRFADTLGVDNATGYKSTNVIVPVNITDTSDDIAGIEFIIWYDANVIVLEGAQKGDLAADGWDPHITEGNRIGSVGSPIPSNSSGSVVLLNFSVTGEPGTRTWMNITAINLSNTTGKMGTASPKNGTFSVAGAQAWYLHTDGVMYRNNLSLPAGTVEIAPQDNFTWRANEPALVDTAFGPGKWTGWLIMNGSLPQGYNLTAEIGAYNISTENFSAAGSEEFSGDVNKSRFMLNIHADAFTVPRSDFLALRVSNRGGGNVTIQTGNGNSFVTSPESDPGYPVPELYTVILLAFGLLTLILIIYVGSDRR